MATKKAMVLMLVFVLLLSSNSVVSEESSIQGAIEKIGDAASSAKVAAEKVSDSISSSETIKNVKDTTSSGASWVHDKLESVVLKTEDSGDKKSP
ncbi:hypothetical protein PanWU01x14_293970 [Parasponia andersonii]|uniref:Transmembrane protein n=1 Tax=Parasponia andersonii TaxID=3476 RepID=A0A2P5AWK3_PARAD|nr:hypothetical protein PanWU01x14_293970 [Parasponia andersonii]